MKHESLEQTARYWVSQDKQERYMWKGTGKRFSLTRERGHDGRIRKVVQEDSFSSMYNAYDYMIVSGKNCHQLSAVYFPCLIMLPMIICARTSGFCQYLFMFIFLQVKNKP